MKLNNIIIFLSIISLHLTNCSREESNVEDCVGEDCETIECDRGEILQLGECVVDIDVDRDLDGIPDSIDNCIDTQNATQSDCDQDGLGDVCDEESLCGIAISGSISLYDEENQTSRQLPDALLEVEGYPQYTLTDAAGQYQLNHFKPGDYHLLIFSPISEKNTSNPVILKRHPFTVPEVAEGELVPIDVIINPPGDIVGAIAFADRPIYEAVHGGIGVYIENIPYIQAITDIRGHFELRGVPAGPQKLKFVYSDYTTTSVEVESISLASIEVGAQGQIALERRQEPENWRHEIQVNVSQLEPSTTISFDVTLIPIFPHLSDSRSVTFTGESNAEGQLSISEEVMHDPHDVFNIIVSETVKRTNLYLLDQPTEQVRESEINTDLLPESWQEFSDQLMYMTSMYDEGILESQNLFSEDYSSLPFGTVNGHDDEWQILQLSDLEGNTVNDVLMRLAPLRYPLTHKFGEIGLAKTHSLIMQTPSGTPAEDTAYQLKFSINTSSWNGALTLAVSPYPCPGQSLEAGAFSIAGCGLAPFDLQERCRLNYNNFEKCSLQRVEIDLHQDMCEELQAGQFECEVEINLSSAHAEMMLWIMDRPLIDQGEVEFSGCDLQCLNRFSSPLTESRALIPLYPLIVRDLIQGNDCQEVSIEVVSGNVETRTVSAVNTPVPHACFPTLPTHDFADNIGGCLAQPARSTSGRHLVITSANFNTGNEIPVADIFGGQLVVDTYFDMNAINPMAVYAPGIVCLNDDSCPWPTRIQYRISDGINVINRGGELWVSQLTMDQEELPYCWSFE